MLVALAMTCRKHRVTQDLNVVWLVDGNNLKCCRGVPSERSIVIEELRKVASPKTTLLDSKRQDRQIAYVVVVFDGNRDEPFELTRSVDDWFDIVVTDGLGMHKDRADEYIVDSVLPMIPSLFHGVPYKVHLITADKQLAKRAVATQLLGCGGSIVNPQKFWKLYLPNLQQQRSDF